VLMQRRYKSFERRYDRPSIVTTGRGVRPVLLLTPTKTGECCE